jgi:tetratricopeptide (TPR) repeat protein
MAQSKSMEDAIRIPIYDLFGQAKEAAKIGDSDTVEHLCDEAWAKVPEPKFGWDVTYMFLLGMAQLLRIAGKYDKAIDVVSRYVASEYFLDYQYGPYFWLGALYFEKGDLIRSYEFFDRANRMSRGRCFDGEDRKYKRFFKVFVVK